MNLYLLTQLIPLLCGGLAFAHGMTLFGKKGVALYFQLLLYAVGCLALGRMFSVVCLLSFGEVPQPFNVASLGFVGCFAFLFSANYGQMDKIIDDGSDEIKPIRFIALIAPVCFLAFLVYALMSPLEITYKIIFILVSLPGIGGSYYNLKHFLAPDNDFLFLKAIRPCNIPAIFIYIGALGQLYFEMTEKWQLEMIFSLVVSLAVLALIYLAERGYKQWKI